MHIVNGSLSVVLYRTYPSAIPATHKRSDVSQSISSCWLTPTIQYLPQPLDPRHEPRITLQPPPLDLIWGSYKHFAPSCSLTTPRRVRRYLELWREREEGIVDCCQHQLMDCTEYLSQSQSTLSAFHISVPGILR